MYHSICKKAIFLFQIILLHIVATAQDHQSSTGDKTDMLFQVIRSGNAEKLQQLLANGADANDRLYGYTALMAAVLSGTTEQLKILMDHGAHINDTTPKGISALWLAVPDRDKTNLLLEHGADVNHFVEGYGVLVKLALTPGTENLFHLMIDKGADPQKSAPDNFLLYNAASVGDTSILGMLIRYNLNVNDSTASGDYPINAALSFRNFATLKMLVDYGANVNVRFRSAFFQSYNGITPLMFAALVNDKPSFFYLLEHGADPNAKNNRGYTALMLLQESEMDDPEMTQALMSHGAIVSVKAYDGSDAVSLAQRKGNTKSVELLKRNLTLH